MNLKTTAETFLHWLPLWFGLGFLAPLVAQTCQTLGWLPPAGLSPITFGLLTGGVLGVLATLRGRWL